MTRGHMTDDPQPRRGFQPGDVVLINVDPYGLCGRLPHPPVHRVTDAEGKTLRIESPCKIGVVASYDAESSLIEWRDGSDEHMVGANYYYVATNAGYYVFADYELVPSDRKLEELA